MAKKRVLTGIQATGAPHIGNYAGAIRPAIEMSKKADYETFLFIADYHALNASSHDKTIFNHDVYEVAATWLACGLDPSKVNLYCQSDIPEIMELAIILSNFTSKGLMNRAHSYKDKVAKNLEEDKDGDPDKGINMGLYLYPLLMASDILTFNADLVPVGKDQIQHLEMTRDIALRFNHYYGEVLHNPEPIIQTQVLVPGLDERKMSKSYGNHIPCFLPEKKLQKLINKIKTDSLPPEAPKETENSVIFSIYKFFSTPSEQEALKERYLKGIGWGEAKAELFNVINRELAPKREVYESLINDKKKIDDILQSGAERARKVASETLKNVKKALGKSRV